MVKIRAVGLKLGRNDSLFVSRNDMDQAQEHAQVPPVHVPLLELIQDWKNRYNFVGSYYIDIGNDPANGQWTDWNVSVPLFQAYVTLGNEIGTHSWTHPHVTDLLSVDEIEFEFNQSMNEIITQLGPTWEDRQIRGGAVPGMPESTATGREIGQYLDYLSGGYSGIGAGYRSAFGYLTPDSNKPYFSPNMFFDFTLIGFGVPMGNPPVAVPLTAEEAEVFWRDQYAELKAHASQPIIHWPWHDYGPTTEADPVTGSGYTVEMFENTIAMAFTDNAEFVTAADAAQRIDTFRDARLDVGQNGPFIDAIVEGTGLGKFSLIVEKPQEQVITQVDDWYAYSKDRVFLDDDGGTFAIQVGTSVEPVSHITALPMRAKLLSLSGDGTNLKFSFEGEGEVVVALSSIPSDFLILGADSVTQRGGSEIGLNFHAFGMHTVSIVRKAAVNKPPVANNQSVVTNEDKPVAITLTGSDADGDPLTFTVVSQPANGLLSGTEPNLTYIPFMDFNGFDSFSFKVNDGNIDSDKVQAAISVNPVNDRPVFLTSPIAKADATVNAVYSGTIAGTATDVDGDVLTYRRVSGPAWLNVAADGTLSGTPKSGDVGANNWTMEVSDANITAQATLAISVTATPNNPPVANDQSIATDEDKPVAITLTGSDADGDPITFTVVSQPTHGTLSGSAPNLTYTPDTGFSGADNFSFKARDLTHESNGARINLRVNPASDGSPSISNPASVITVDGDLADWSHYQSFGDDPNDVDYSVNNQIDWLEGWIAHDDQYIYLAYRNDGDIALDWGQQIYIDTDENFATGYQIGTLGADYVIEGDIVERYKGNGDTWDWDVMGTMLLSVRSSLAEYRFPRSWLGDATKFRLIFYGDNTAYNGTTIDPYPNGAEDESAKIRYFVYATLPAGGSTASVTNGKSVQTN